MRNTLPLTTQMKQSPHMSRRAHSGRGHTGSCHTGPRCAQRMDVPALGTFRLFLWRTSHQKCTLQEEQSFQVKRRQNGRREGDYQRENASSFIFPEDQTLINCARTHAQQQQSTQFKNPHGFSLHHHVCCLFFLFCFHNSISPRKYLPWPLPAEHRALQ